MIQEVKGDIAVEEFAQTLEGIIEKRKKYLSDYQNDALAARYEQLVRRIQNAEQKTIAGNSEILAIAAAKYYHKLLAYKDEYEVARLYTDGSFLDKLKAEFGGDYKLEFNMAPSIFGGIDPATGRPKKRAFGPWMMGALRILAKLKTLRGTPLDIFGYTAERKMERDLITQYEKTAEYILNHLKPENLSVAAEILSIPDIIRGYGPVKHENVEQAKKLNAELMDKFDNPETLRSAA